MDYWFDGTSSAGTMNFTTDANIDCTSTFTVSAPDPLIDWLPNSCLYTKYVPTWHLINSYNIDRFDRALTRCLIENDELFKRLAKEKF